MSTLPPMRIVSWNLQEGFARKKEALTALAPDVAVLCEVSLANPFAPSLLVEGNVSWHSAGRWPHKSLAVAAFGSELRDMSSGDPRGQFGVAVEHENHVGVLGVWSVQSDGRRYGDEVLDILDQHGAWIATGDVIVAGDFNIDAHGVGNGPKGKKLFQALVDRLADLGLVSAYHAWSGEAFGAESRMTHFHLRKPDRPYHLDYCFIPKRWTDRIQNVEIGGPGQWLALSDHMPLIVDLDLPSSVAS